MLDMDVDVIGGVINFIIKVVFENSCLLLIGGIGENDLMDDGIVCGSVIYGGCFDESRMGFVVIGSVFEMDCGFDNFEVDYDDGEFVEFDLCDYMIMCECYGLIVGFDCCVNDGMELCWNGIYNEFGDQEFWCCVINIVEDGEVECEFKDCYEEQQIFLIIFGGNMLIGGCMLFEYCFVYSEVEENEFGCFDIKFI